MEKLTSERARTPPKRLLMPRISMKSGAVCRAADSRWLGTLVMAGSEIASTRDATNKSCIGGPQPKGGELVHCAFIDRQEFDDPNIKLHVKLYMAPLTPFVIKSSTSDSCFF